MLAIYCRVSGLGSRNNKLNKNTSIENQKKFGIEFAKENDFKYKIYVDEGVSGTKFPERQGLQDMLADIEDGLVNIVWFYDQSRLERSPKIRFLLNSIFTENHVKLYENGKLIDFNNHEQMLFSDLKSVLNQYYTIQSTRKIKNAKNSNAINGKANGMLPFGYKTDKDNYIIVDAEESKLVKEIYKKSLSGIGARMIALDFDKRSISHRRKSLKWYDRTILSIIKNPIYKGERIYNGVSYSVPSIVSPKYWQEVNDNLENNKKFTGKSNEYKYLLKNHIKCSCSRNYFGRRRQDKNKMNSYQCSSKLINSRSKCKSVNIDILDELVMYNLIFCLRRELENFNRNDLNFSIYKLKEKLKFLNNDLKTNKRKSENLVVSVAEGILDKNTISTMFNKLKKEESEINNLILNTKHEIESLELDIKKYNNKSNFIKSVNSYSFIEKRELLDKFVIGGILLTDTENGFKKVEILNVSSKGNFINKKITFYLKNVSAPYYYYSEDLKTIGKIPKNLPKYSIEDKINMFYNKLFIK